MFDQLADLLRRGAEALRGLLDPNGEQECEPAYAPVPVLVPVRTRSRATRYGRYR